MSTDISDVIDGAMDLKKTEELFDKSIERGESLKGGSYTDKDIKNQRLVLGFGNLHINTAKVKMAAVRFLGYRDAMQKTKNAVERKVRNSRKYPR